MVLKALAKKLASLQHDWAFITDCAEANFGGLQTMWLGVKVFLFLWHVCRAGLKQEVSKIKDHAIHVVVLKGLGQIMYNTKCPEELK